MSQETPSFQQQNNILQFCSLTELREASIDRISLAIGVFDGVHLGHQKLLQVLINQAEKTKSVPVAMTFFPHPRQILTPDAAPPLLLPPSEKIRLLQEHGVKAAVTLPFTGSFSRMPPKLFLENCLESSGITVTSLCVGSHWRFGAGGQGDCSYLAKVSAEKHFEFCAVPELELNGETVSSSGIRKAILEADLTKAALYLGHPYTLYGVVEHGKQLAGTKLGHPTANLRTEYGVLPPCGVYACKAYVNGECLPQVCNIGRAPTFDSYGEPDLMRVEVHLLSGGRDLYGVSMALALVSRIREERKFQNSDTLKEQICLDVKQALEILK